MGEVFFYHLTRSPLEEALPLLLGRTLERGWRVVLRGTDAGRLAWLDEALWLGDGTFLPHGLAGGPHDADQPVLLTTAADNPAGAACLMTLDGAEVSEAEGRALERVCVIFDGNDPDAVAAARRQWKALTGCGLAAKYWSEDGGRWEMKAESRGATAG